jgi:hypothetical protein
VGKDGPISRPVPGLPALAPGHCVSQHPPAVPTAMVHREMGTLGQGQKSAQSVSPGRRWTPGDIIPEWWATSSRNGRQIPKSRAPADAMTGAPHVARGAWDWGDCATVMQIIGRQSSAAKSSTDYRVSGRSAERDRGNLREWCRYRTTALTNTCAGCLLEGVPIACMRQNDPETSPGPLKPEEVAELQTMLQTDNIAPVDRMTFGMRLAELIMRVRNLSKRRQRK